MFSKYSLTIAKFNHLFSQDLPFDKMHFSCWSLNLLGGVGLGSMFRRAGGLESKVQILRLAFQAEEAAWQKSE